MVKKALMLQRHLCFALEADADGDGCRDQSWRKQKDGGKGKGDIWCSLLLQLRRAELYFDPEL